jgi:glycosyltransferase involved in cell wall biosynthesis
MKVLFVYRFLTLGGVETVLRARLDGLQRWGIEAHAWFFHDLGGGPVFRGLRDRVHVGGPEACLRFLDGGGFDLVSSIDTEEILRAAAGRTGPRLILECHTPYQENLEYLRRLGPCRPAVTFVPSFHQREVVLERMGEGAEVRVVPNPLHRDFVEEPRPFQAPPPRPVVAWIGRMDDLKNWQGFVRLAGILERSGPPAEFWMAGGFVGQVGVDDLLRSAREEGILSRLRWFRNLPHARVPAFFDAVRDSGGVVVSTSRGESFGMTVAEAMARGCPVLAPRRPPFTEFVEDGATGELYPLPKGGGEVWEPVAGRIQELLADACRRERLGRAGREAILRDYSPAPAISALARELENAARS